MGASKRSGVLVLDKPEGISSAKVVAIVKKALGAGKAGHAGTLDPLATGVLVCCVNDATRLARFLMQGQKAYEAVLRLGQQTDSLDATGHVLETAPDAAVAQITATQIDAVARRFVGRIEQQPPVYSALKHKGTPLYRLARKGHPVQKPPRAVHIDDVQILSVDLPRVRFAVTCSPGTYIRTLAADMGAALGCGGHLEALRRTASSGFTLADALPLSAIAPRGREGVGDGGRPLDRHAGSPQRDAGNSGQRGYAQQNRPRAAAHRT
jgi:tRNA pseudouridine55 synthase